MPHRLCGLVPCYLAMQTSSGRQLVDLRVGSCSMHEILTVKHLLHKLVASAAGSVGVVKSIASDRLVAQQLLQTPLQQEPATAIEFGTFLFNAQFKLPVSARPFQLVKAYDPGLAGALYQCGDCLIRAAVSDVLQLSHSMLGKSYWHKI